MIEIKEIASQETVPIRSRILRPGQDLSACIYPHDDDESTFHLGAYIKDEMVCIVSFYKEAHPEFKEANQYRFRGMATLEEFRKKGAATAILRYAFDKLTVQKTELVWCNARINALGLYQNLGMEICSDEFDIPGIGPHLLLKLKL
jgi:predicted GNAT family N-acyltransferase